MSPANEPVLSYAPGTPERFLLRAELERQSATPVTAPLFIGGEAVTTLESDEIRAPHRHSLLLGTAALASPSDVANAIEAARAAKSAWAARDAGERAAVFLRAADLLAGPWRQRLNAATMIGQSKTAYQAEIDSACELVDFFRFNAHFYAQLAEDQPLAAPGIENRMELRPLDGFVVAVSPFNFTAIAGNLPSAPALAGNTVVWKPSPLAALSAHHVMELLREAGLPPGVINLVQGDAAAITRQLVEHADFSGLHFTGSTAVFDSLCARVGANLSSYRSYPRIVGETGGKDFIVAHPSADLAALSVGIVRGGFEYQGQKCSAASRVYVPRSLWPELEERLRAMVAELRVGDPSDFRSFMGAVIGRQAFERLVRYQTLAKGDPSCRVIAGGGADASVGFFVDPTLVLVTDARHRLMTEEIFGPLVALWVYDDDRFEETLELCDSTSPYALTGAVFARSRDAVELASKNLRFAAGNFYVNDKPTGAVVGQQPFGGARRSGTNDKAGSAWNVARWISPRVIKENLSPPTDWRYPSMDGD